jgi:glycosyl transferase family 2
MSETLTACVIARDEEQRLPGCLQSLSFCDEVVVVDSGSRDRTREIAAAAGARVIENPWRGFAVQRNVALDHASSSWVLEIDADERVTPELAREVREMLADPPVGVRMAALPMRDVFLGAGLGRSARYPRYRHRLFRRGAFRHDESRTVHEGLWPDGSTVALQGELRHLLADSWSEALRDAIAYARLEALQRPRPRPPAALAGTLLRPAAKFAYRLLLYGGWRDGGRGTARIWLDCFTDSLATVYSLRNEKVGGAGQTDGEPPRVGPPRLVGVAVGAAGTPRLTAWLEQAGGAGADVALIASRPTGSTAVRRRALEGVGPGALARALDAEDQIRPIDALVLAGRRERLLLAAVPRALQGAMSTLHPSTPAVDAVRSVRERTRGGGDDLNDSYSPE